MRIQVANESPDFSRQVNGIPPIDTQRAVTQVLVSDGETTVIGGIYVSREQATQDRTPGALPAAAARMAVQAEHRRGREPRAPHLHHPQDRQAVGARVRCPERRIARGRPPWHVPPALSGCSETVREGDGPVQAMVTSLEAAPGAEPNKFGGTLSSDVLTLVKKDDQRREDQGADDLLRRRARGRDAGAEESGRAGLSDQPHRDERRDLHPLPGGLQARRRPQHAGRGRAVPVRFGGNLHRQSGHAGDRGLRAGAHHGQGGGAAPGLGRRTATPSSRRSPM